MDRIEYLRKNKYPKIDKHLFEAGVNADPTKEKKYADWILRLLSFGKITEGMLGSLHRLLIAFHSVKNRLSPEFKDINRFSCPIELTCILSEHLMATATVKNDRLEEIIYRIHEDDRWLIVSPITFEASQKYGSGTKWCTTARQTFYTYMASGMLYIVIDKTKGERTANRKLQFCFARNEYRNSVETEVDIIGFFIENRNAWSGFEKVGVFDMENVTFFGKMFSGKFTDDEQLEAYKKFGKRAIKLFDKPCVALIAILAEEVAKERAKEEELDDVFPDDEDKWKKYIGDYYKEWDRRKDKDNRWVKTYYTLQNHAHEIGKFIEEKMVENSPDAVLEMSNPSDRLVELALRKKPSLWKSVGNKNIEVAFKAAKLNTDIASYVKFRGTMASELSDIVIRTGKYSNLSFLDIPEEKQLEIAKNNPERFHYVVNQCESAKMANDMVMSEITTKKERWFKNIMAHEMLRCISQAKNVGYDSDNPFLNPIALFSDGGGWNGTDFTDEEHEQIQSEFLRLSMKSVNSKQSESEKQDEEYAKVASELGVKI